MLPKDVKRLKALNEGMLGDVLYPPTKSTIKLGWIKEEHHGYSDTNIILYVVYNHKRSPVDPLDHNVYIGPGFGVSNAIQMVPHSPRNL